MKSRGVEFLDTVWEAGKYLEKSLAVVERSICCLPLFLGDSQRLLCASDCAVTLVVRGVISELSVDSQCQGLESKEVCPLPGICKHHMHQETAL